MNENDLRLKRDALIRKVKKNKQLRLKYQDEIQMLTRALFNKKTILKKSEKTLT